MIIFIELKNVRITHYSLSALRLPILLSMMQDLGSQLNSTRIFTPSFFSGLEPAVCNAFRRIMVAEIPTWMFTQDKVKVTHNFTKFHTHMMEKRLSLITVNQKAIEELIEGLEKEKSGASPDKIVFYLSSEDDRTRPLENTSTLSQDVHIRDLKAFYEDDKISDDLVYKILPYNSLLLILAPGQKIHCKMMLERGIGRQHARWNACFCAYKFMTKNDQDGPTDIESIEEEMQIIHRSDDPFNDPAGILLTVESIGVMHPRAAISQAAQILHDKIQKVKDALEGKESNITLVREPNLNMIKISIPNETRTLSRAISQFLLKRVMLGKPPPEQLNEWLITDRTIHPLKALVEITVKLPAKQDLMDFIQRGVEDLLVQMLTLVKQSVSLPSSPS